jgi:peptidoglycan/LPS O-acetylase OafA/YrhL
MLQCVEVMLVVILAMIPQVSIPIELTYIAPLTSQAAAIGVVLLSSSGMKRGRPAKNTADHLLFLSLFIMVISALVAGLSLSGYYEKLILPQWLLHMTVSTVNYRLPEKEQQDDRRWYRL